MKTQRFGIEIEFTGMTRLIAARVIAKHFGTTETFRGGTYDEYHIKDSTDRTWKIVSDASIVATGNSLSKCEMVSPICNYDDIETIQEIVRELRAEGMKVNSSTGIHIHIDASTHTAQSLKNLANIMSSKEDLLFEALKVEPERANRWCKKVDNTFLDKLNTRTKKDKNKIKKIWYNGRDESHMHYSQTRYRALNLHSVWQKGTVEFRCFNSTTHAGKIKAYIQLCLAISNQAKTQAGATRRHTQTTNAKYTFRTWLLRMGLIGDEFKTARQHLLSNLSGNIAWRNKGVA